VLDTKIINGRVYDGSGNPWFYADIGIEDGRIVFVGDLSQAGARQTIDARGLAVCPGFIDIHSHSDRSLAAQNKGISSLQQGITTQVTGNCGHSLAPTRDAAGDLADVAREHGLADLAPEWTNFGQYLDWQANRGVGINMAPLVGHGAVRRFVMGPEGKGGERLVPTPEQLAGMRAAVGEAMEAGAFGLSVGLEYPPGRNAATAELIELCKVVAAHGGYYATHMRSEGQAPAMEWFGAIVETIEISRLSGARAEISHLKSDQRGAWWKTEAVLRLLSDARGHGIQVTADVYPYPFAAVGYLYSVLPPALSLEGIPALLARLNDPSERTAIRAQIEQGIPEWTNPANSFGWGAIGIVETSDLSLVGLSIEDAAERRAQDPLDVCFDLLIADHGLTRSSVGVMADENIQAKLRHPLTMVSTDGLCVDSYPVGLPGEPPPKLHPRTVSTYPRLLGRYVRELGTLTMAEAIRKSTSLPAATAGIKQRGLLVPGNHADIVVFDPATVGEVATFADPHHPPRGIEHVLVNGQAAVTAGKPTGALAGHVLRHGR
jgi:N-acyl-D-amino-acid deacylase